jgi:S1-C subfamily serine protease
VPQPAPEPVVEAPKPPPPPRNRTAAEILQDASTSGGQLLSYSMSGTATPIGMAMEIDQNQMVTTCHAIPAGAKLVVKVAGQMHPAELSITDEQLDLCRLLVPGFGTPPLRLATDDAKAGDPIVAVGVNAKGEIAATEGTVTQVRTTPLGKVLEVSMPIAPTASGGGIFNLQGQLVGLATTPHTFGANLNIALPVSWVAQMRSRTTPEKPAQ